jgi:hypothetical protein
VTGGDRPPRAPVSAAVGGTWQQADDLRLGLGAGMRGWWAEPAPFAGPGWLTAAQLFPRPR